MLRSVCHVWIFLVLLSVASSAAEDAVPSLETIRTTYLAYVGSIHTMESEIEMTQVTQERRNGSEETRSVAFEMRVMRTGDLRSRRTLIRNADGEPQSLLWCGYDGRLYARWRMCPEERRLCSSLPFGEIKPEVIYSVYEELTIEMLTGEMWGSRETPLGELLALPGTRVVGWEAVGDAPCVKLVTPRHVLLRRYPEMLSVETTMWLDPGLECLPRRIQSLDYTERREPLSNTVETTEFREYTGADGRKYTLPAAGRRTYLHADYTMTVKSAVINGKLSREVFKPKFPLPCKIMETLPNQPLRERYLGATAKEYELLSLQAQERAGKLKINGVPATVKQILGEEPLPEPPKSTPLPNKPQPFPWRYVFMASTVLLLIVGLLKRRQ